MSASSPGAEAAAAFRSANGFVLVGVFLKSHGK